MSSSSRQELLKQTPQKITVENVLPKLQGWLSQGQRVCLATLYHADNTSPRPVGSQMAVAENGEWFGYLSGGCAEQAIADEAVATIKHEQNRIVRYGVGSPYLDIQLPCGAGIDVCFDQSLNAELVQTLLDCQAQRQLAGLETSLQQNAQSQLREADADDLEPSNFRRWYVPQRRLIIVGAGPSVAALTALAIQADYQLQVLTPDRQTLNDVLQYTDAAELLESQTQIEALLCDAWTAVVLMFHEHERETQMLQYFLSTNVYYIGALGSRLTQQIRLNLLHEQGVSKSVASRVHGPVGLAIQARTPAEIAISVLAELTAEYQSSATELLEFRAVRI